MAPMPSSNIRESIGGWDCIDGHPRKVDARLPGKGNSNSNGARPVHLIITMIKWTKTSRLSIKNSLYTCARGGVDWSGHRTGVASLGQCYLLLGQCQQKVVPRKCQGGCVEWQGVRPPSSTNPNDKTKTR